MKFSFWQIGRTKPLVLCKKRRNYQLILRNKINISKWKAVCSSQTPGDSNFMGSSQIGRTKPLVLCKKKRKYQLILRNKINVSKWKGGCCSQTSSTPFVSRTVSQQGVIRRSYVTMEREEESLA